jgi:E3 ubiquitin-protein ligase CCNP1IP1
MADLKPSEEWKSMIISAQKPEVIAEICGRAISFWTYQMHQECCYQELLLKNFQERKTSNEKSLQTSIMQLKNELLGAQESIADLNKQVEIGKRKEADLLDQMNEKSRQMKKMQLLCDSMRKKVSLNSASGEIIG